MWWQKIQSLWKIKDLRNSILFVALLLVVFRLVAHIPLPGVNQDNLRLFFNQNQFLGLLNVFSGGSMEKFSIAMLGVAPYITASIIFQLLAMIIPKLEEMTKEERGRQKVNQYTRLLTIPLAVLQGYAMIKLLQSAPQPVIRDLTNYKIAVIVLTVTAGTIFLMWLGELITEKKIGNGISLLITAGIVGSIPEAVSQKIATFDSTQIPSLIILLVLILAVVAAIVYIELGQRKIPISYARQIRGNQSVGGGETYLPLMINQGGVIPIIFAVSMVSFPQMLAGFFIHSSHPLLVSVAEKVNALFINQWFYGIFYFVLVVAFSFFYTEIAFHPSEVAENLQKQGGFIPGYRPGQATTDFLQKTVYRICLSGAIFLGLIAVMPVALQQIFPDVKTLVIGGTSLLIVIQVFVKDILWQIQSQISMHEYDKL